MERLALVNGLAAVTSAIEGKGLFCTHNLNWQMPACRIVRFDKAGKRGV